jgi:MFS superfamily sulfate permease-like transporter
LLTGIGIGMVVAIFIILYNNYRKPFLFEKEEHINDGVIRIELAEDVTFINKANIQRALASIPDYSKVIIDASKSVNIDIDILEIIEDFKTQVDNRHIELEIIDRKRKGLTKAPSKSFEKEMSSD